MCFTIELYLLSSMSFITILITIYSDLNFYKNIDALRSYYVKSTVLGMGKSCDPGPALGLLEFRVRPEKLTANK